MKKFSNTLKMAILTATVPFGMLASTSASAELSASATVASSYLWRGFELGTGTPAISADLVYSNSGFYAAFGFHLAIPLAEQSMTYSLVTADQSVRAISYDFLYHLYLPNRSIFYY